MPVNSKNIMPMCEILEDYHPAEKWQVGDIVDISNPERLIEEGKVKLADIIPEEVSTDLKCETCGFEAKSLSGLISHKKTHDNGNNTDSQA